MIWGDVQKPTFEFSRETESLIEASRILKKAFRATLSEPEPICRFVYDAELYVDKLLKEHLFSEPK